MTTTASETVVVNGERVAETLKEVCGKLPADAGEVLLDFFLVQTLDPAAIKGLEDLAGTADVLKVKVILRGVNVEIYKVLKLSGLSDRFLFIN
jgi:anti-anti-sigma regulatory factor